MTPDCFEIEHAFFKKLIARQPFTPAEDADLALCDIPKPIYTCDDSGCKYTMPPEREANLNRTRDDPLQRSRLVPKH